MENEIDEITLCNIIEVLLRDELIAEIVNMGDSIFVKFENGDLFSIRCIKVKKTHK